METEDSIREVGLGTTLNGWKDIASYVGKSVRAVQRWERDFGLPVHRIKTPTGHIVYAFRTEIDDWRVAMRSRPEEATHERADLGLVNADAPAGKGDDEHGDRARASGRATESEPSLKHPSRRGRLAWLSISGAAAFLLLVGGFLISKAGALAPTVRSYEVSGTSLVALTSDRRPVWSHDFGWQPQTLKYGAPGLTRAITADLDGDGRQEVLALIHAPGENGEPWRESIFCFSDTGSLKWLWTPSFKLSYEGRVFEGPWRNYDMIRSTAPGRQRVWVSFGHHTWWPSVAVELDAAGKATPRYFQSGAIYELTHWSTGSGNYLVAGGVNNEYARASIAVLRVDGPPVTSPQNAGTGFRCDSCPADGPEFFAGLPRTELNLMSGLSYNLLGGATAHGPDLKLSTEERGSYSASGVPSALYYLRDDFTFHDHAVSDSYRDVHQRLEADKKITHTIEDCQDLREARSVLTWTRAKGWKDVPVSIGARALPVR